MLFSLALSCMNRPCIKALCAAQRVPRLDTVSSLRVKKVDPGVKLRVSQIVEFLCSLTIDRPGWAWTIFYRDAYRGMV